MSLQEENVRLKEVISEMLDLAEEYTGGLACVWCDGEMEEDEDGNETGFLHEPECLSLKARELLQ